MSYTAPSADDVRERFPEFTIDKVTDDQIDAYVAEASRRVDTLWLEDDASVAMIYLAAHMMATEGRLRSQELTPLADVVGPITAESLGDASVTYGTVSRNTQGVSLEDQDLSSTQYGRLFVTLRRRNLPGLILI